MTLALRRIRALTLVVALLALSTLCGVGRASAASVPFTDPNAKGFLALCDKDNQTVTGGNINAVPFVWKAVSSLQPPAAFLGRGENVALTIYDPMQGLTPDYWSGDQLTGASYYTDQQYPTAQGTYDDIPLSAIIKEIPPSWNGMYQLRMIFAKSTYQGEDTDPYPATTIQVTGDTWHVLQGGTLPCGAAEATSDESYLGLGATPSPGVPTPGASASGSDTGPAGSGSSSTGTGTGSPSSGAPASTGAGSQAGPGPSSASGSVVAAAAGSGSAGSTPAGAASSSKSSSAGLGLGLGIGGAVLVLAVGGGAWYWRSRNRAAPS